MICPNCGTNVLDGGTVCPNCGNVLASQENQSRSVYQRPVEEQQEMTFQKPEEDGQAAYQQPVFQQELFYQQMPGSQQDSPYQPPLGDPQMMYQQGSAYQQPSMGQPDYMYQQNQMYAQNQMYPQGSMYPQYPGYPQMMYPQNYEIIGDITPKSILIKGILAASLSFIVIPSVIIGIINLLKVKQFYAYGNRATGQTITGKALSIFGLAFSGYMLLLYLFAFVANYA